MQMDGLMFHVMPLDGFMFAVTVLWSPAVTDIASSGVERREDQ
jgi:hypothetical protein